VPSHASHHVARIVRLKRQLVRAQRLAVVAFRRYSRYYVTHPKEQHHVKEKL
jgi:hypothetical protein